MKTIQENQLTRNIHILRGTGKFLLVKVVGSLFQHSYLQIPNSWLYTIVARMKKLE